MICEVYDIIKCLYEYKKDIILTIIVGGIGLYVGIQVVSSVPDMIMVNL
jgi:hypothetical protein